MYEVYDRPGHISFELLDRALAHSFSFLNLPDAQIVLIFDEFEPPYTGVCDYEEDEITITVSSFLDEKDTLLTIFHELTHAKQYLEGKIDFESFRGVSYIDWPWEKEAYEMEDQMWLAFTS